MRSGMAFLSSALVLFSQAPLLAQAAIAPSPCSLRISTSSINKQIAIVNADSISAIVKTLPIFRVDNYVTVDFNDQNQGGEGFNSSFASNQNERKDLGNGVYAIKVFTIELNFQAGNQEQLDQATREAKKIVSELNDDFAEDMKTTAKVESVRCN